MGNGDGLVRRRGPVVEISLRYTRSGLAIAYVYIRKTDGGLARCRAFGETALRMSRTLKDGDMIHVAGMMKYWTFQQDGKEHVQEYFSIFSYRKEP